MGFFQNTCKPKGLGGKVMVRMMNNGHAKMADWGFSHIAVPKDSRILDAGCGGGANVSLWLQKCPEGHVTGLDYSKISVEASRRLNSAAIQKGCCEIFLGNVAQMPFADGSFDCVSAFETIYFWPGLELCFAEVKRILRPGGQFLIVVESDGTNPADKKWMKKINGMVIYGEDEIRDALQAAGFADIQAAHNDKGWMCLVAHRAENGKAL